MHLGISVVQLLILFIFNFKNTRVAHLYQIYAAFVSLASPHPTMTSLICATVRNEYTNSLRNDVSNLFVNTHVRVKIYRDLTLGRNDINDVVGRWGDVSYV
jgi:hypothetical protein